MENSNDSKELSLLSESLIWLVVSVVYGMLPLLVRVVWTNLSGSAGSMAVPTFYVFWQEGAILMFSCGIITSRAYETLHERNIITDKMRHTILHFLFPPLLIISFVIAYLVVVVNGKGIIAVQAALLLITVAYAVYTRANLNLARVRFAKPKMLKLEINELIENLFPLYGGNHSITDRLEFVRCQSFVRCSDDEEKRRSVQMMGCYGTPDDYEYLESLEKDPNLSDAVRRRARTAREHIERRFE